MHKPLIACVQHSEHTRGAIGGEQKWRRWNLCSTSGHVILSSSLVVTIVVADLAVVGRSTKHNLWLNVIGAALVLGV